MERLFRFKERGTSFRIEIVAGLTTFKYSVALDARHSPPM